MTLGRAAHYNKAIYLFPLNIPKNNWVTINKYNLTTTHTKKIDPKPDRNLSEFGNLPNLCEDRSDLGEDEDL
jgi:hypothetical protein